MMKTLKLQLLAGLFLGTLLFAGCKDECKDVTCVQGACVEGNCVCDAGYSGADCSVALNAKFNGAYNATVNCNLSGAGTHTVTVAPKSGTADQVIISGLYYANGQSVTAKVATDGTTFSIAKQDLGISGYDLESTSGTINVSFKAITLAYKVYQSDSILLETCTTSLALQ